MSGQAHTPDEPKRNAQSNGQPAHDQEAAEQPGVTSMLLSMRALPLHSTPARDVSGGKPTRKLLSEEFLSGPLLPDGQGVPAGALTDSAAPAFPPENAPRAARAGARSAPLSPHRAPSAPRTLGRWARRREFWLLGSLVIAILAVSTSLLTLAQPATPRSAVALLPAGGRGASSALTPLATLPPTVAPTPTTPPTPTATPIPLPPNLSIPPFCNADQATPAPVGTGTPTPTMTPTPTGCAQCPYYYTPNNPSQSDIVAALNTAADTYKVPRNLLYALAHLESNWHQNLVSCSFDIGVLQLKWRQWQSVDRVDDPGCGLTATQYSPWDLKGNAMLGAKLIAWLRCYYLYRGGSAGTPPDPAGTTLTWYYDQAHLQTPDTKLANGSPNPASLCAAVAKDPAHPEYSALPVGASDAWSCPFSAKAGDHTLLDIVISAYNEGAGTLDAQGIQNQWYVTIIEQYIVQAAQNPPH